MVLFETGRSLCDVGVARYEGAVVVVVVVVVVGVGVGGGGGRCQCDYCH